MNQELYKAFGKKAREYSLKEGFLFKETDVVKHVKSNGDYMILNTDTVLEATGEPAYAYQKWGEPDAPIYVRSKSEMEDGRFIKLH